MQLKQNASKDFIYLAPADKVILGASIINHLSASAGTFSGLPYDVAQLQATNTNLSEAAAAAKNGDHTAIDIRNNNEREWDIEFGTTAGYISSIAKGDAALISKAGFTPTKDQRSPKSRPADATGGKAIASMQEGSADISVKAQPEADAFLYLALPADAVYSVASDGMFTITLAGGQKVYAKCDTHRSTRLGSLDSGAKLQVLVQPVNTAGAGIPMSMKVTPQ